MLDKPREIESIVIVGGGSTGWMAATYLQRFHPRTKITLVESPTEPPLGVGESLNAISRRFNHAIGLNEKDFLRHVDGTFKIGIEFQGFDTSDGRFFHPFGKPDHTHLSHPDADSCYLTTRLCRQGRIAPDNGVHGYHVCATRYGQYLREIAVRRGVKHIRRHIEKVQVGPNGIENVDGIGGDLFIDCTGFKSLLLGQALDQSFQPIDDRLLNDRAVAVRAPYDGEPQKIPPYTRCVAEAAGWIWEIPLWSRLGAGYCFSSRHLSYEEAEQTLRAHLGITGSEELSVFQVPFKHGRYAAARYANCVALGNAFGFIEPLESTGLSLTQANIMLLSARLTQLDEWSRMCCRRFDTTVDFILVHYRLSRRRDTSYWRDIQKIPLGVELQSLLEDARQGDYRQIENDKGHFYRPANWDIILSGMGYFGAGQAGQSSAVDEAYPFHADYLKEEIHCERT